MKHFSFFKILRSRYTKLKQKFIKTEKRNPPTSVFFSGMRQGYTTDFYKKTEIRTHTQKHNYIAAEYCTMPL